MGNSIRLRSTRTGAVLGVVCVAAAVRRVLVNGGAWGSVVHRQWSRSASERILPGTRFLSSRQRLCQAVYGFGDISVYELIISHQVDVASGGSANRKEFSRRILPLRSAKHLMERAPSIYYGLGYAVLLGIVHRMLPWHLPTRALDSTVTFLNTTDCRTGRRARRPTPLSTSRLLWTTLSR